MAGRTVPATPQQPVVIPQDEAHGNPWPWYVRLAPGMVGARGPPPQLPAKTITRTPECRSTERGTTGV